MRPARRVLNALPIVLLALVIVSCDADRPAPPTAPLAVPDQPAVSLGEAGDPILAAKIINEINALFDGLPRQEQARQHFAQVVSQWNKQHPEQARAKTATLITHTLTQLDQRLIRDPDGAGPLDALSGSLALFNDLYAYVGLPTDDQEVDGDTYLAVVPPSNQTQTFASGLQQWTVIPPNTFNQSVLLYVNREREDPDLESGFPPASAPYEVHFVPDLPFDIVYIAICPDFHDLPFGSTRLAHERDDGVVEILDPVPNSFMCEFDEEGGGVIGDATPSLRPRGFLAHARPMLKRALDILTPTTLYAGHAATMGGVIDLSPLQVVIVGTDIDATAEPVTYGEDAIVNVALFDAAGAALPGAPVSITVDGEPAGSATTNADGRAQFVVSGLAAGSHPFVVSHVGMTEVTTTSSGTIVVNRAPLVLTASSGRAQLGTTIPACTVSYEGLVNDETPESLGDVSTCTYDGLPLGTHQVLPSPIDPANYTVERVPGTFTLFEGEIIG